MLSASRASLPPTIDNGAAMKSSNLACLCILLLGNAVSADVVVGGTGASCAEDPACFNRIHAAIVPVATASPGETLVFHGRDAGDLYLDPDKLTSAGANPRRGLGVVHPLTGPVHIEGAKAGDTLAVHIVSLEPGAAGWTMASPGGFAGDLVGTDSLFVSWRLNDKFATSDALPGVRIPNASFPGVLTTLPGPEQQRTMLAREKALADTGGAVLMPDPKFAEPAALCGEEGTHQQECLRTIPPREHGGNMDIRYMQAGTTVYLPCFIDGCGLAVGDFHYAQGDGEVSGTAIEMDGVLTVTTSIGRNGADLSRGPHYEGPSRVLGIPSGSFYATTGFPLKQPGDLPREIAYLASEKIRPLGNLSKDLNLAARNALAAMIDHIVTEYGYNRSQAYIIASVAVDLRIAQLVDAPNVGVTAILPVDIFDR